MLHKPMNCCDFACRRYEAGIEIEVARSASGSYEVTVRADPARPMLLHWAVNEWQPPPESAWPANTHRVSQPDPLYLS